MYPESDFLPLSALQHLSFCARQCGLIHLEQQWEENRWTAEGRVLHERADMDMTEVRGNLRTAFGLRIHSARLGLVGRADIVEFRRAEGGDGGLDENLAPEYGRPPTGELRGGLSAAISLPGVRGLWTLAPVEYKRGKPKKDLSDKVQLCAQGLCLEEMLGVAVPVGALYYGKTRRRLDVPLDDALRTATEALVTRLHALMDEGVTPPPEPGPKCERCSLKDVCIPETVARSSSVGRYLLRHMKSEGDVE